MKLGASLKETAFATGANALVPHPRPVGDGTYEVAVPLPGRSRPLILPYSFSSEEDALLWIGSRKGRKRIEMARISLE
jgi:hypothetical protein